MFDFKFLKEVQVFFLNDLDSPSDFPNPEGME
jgi:hypothetical protein